MTKRQREPWFRLDPLTRKRVDRFKSIRRGYWSLLLVVGLIVFALLGEIFINSRALLVVYQGRVTLPTYGRVHLGTEFGLDYKYETNYRDLKKKLAETGEGFVLLAPVPWNAFEQDFKEGTYPPYAPSLSSRHFLGTDAIGRDILARLVYGFRIAILFAILYVGITYFIGAAIGGLMGYWGGIFDLVFQRIIEVWEQVPFLYVVMIIQAIFRPDFGIFLFIFIFFGWSGRTWTVRAMTYRERERDYVLAAKSMGAGTWRIISVHIIPNILVVIVTILPFSISGAISSLTALDYLGFGLRPPTPSWGELISQGLNAYKEAPWILASVVTAMSLILVMITFIGEGLRDAFDPKKYTVYK